jgi:DNA-binding transcriptional LysR family regulator
MAAVRTGKFWAIVPEIALRELPAGLVTRIADPALATLAREAMLAWNPRLVRVRPRAARVAAALHAALRVG